MKYTYKEKIDLLEDCFVFFYNHGFARSKAAFCRDFLKKAGSYMAKIDIDRLPSIDVWAKLLVFL